MYFLERNITPDNTSREHVNSFYCWNKSQKLFLKKKKRKKDGKMIKNLIDAVGESQVRYNRLTSALGLCDFSGT